MRRKEYKSQGYLEFLGTHPCCITKTYENVDLHHEALLCPFTGERKRRFDFGALPLDHELHLNDRHATGKVEFWERHGLDPLELAIEFVEGYLETWPEDEALAQEALEMLKSVRKD